MNLWTWGGLLVAAAAFWPGWLVGQVELPAGGVDAIQADGLASEQPRVLGKVGKLERLETDGKPTVRVSVGPPGEGESLNPWEVNLRYPSTIAIRKGEVLLLAFEARTVDAKTETGEGRMNVTGQLARAPWTRLGQIEFSPGKSWAPVYVPMQADRDFAIGESQFGFDFGFRPQTLELRNLQVLHYGTKLSKKDLPRTATTYAGREPDASWRKAAAERIETLRKGDLTVKVLDADGQPVAGARVLADQTSHAFGFGTAVPVNRLLADGPDGDRYREILSKYFNYAVFENDLKWTLIERADPAQQLRHRSDVRRGIRWLLAEGFRIRGHCLVWPGTGNDHYLPKDVRDMAAAKDAAGIQKRIASHIADVAGSFSGLLTDWDVINEPVHNRDLQDVVGREAMIEWFKQAHAADPNARLFLNDYTMLSGGASNQANIDAFFNNVKFLKEGGAPIHGIGEQAHFGWNVTEPARIVQILDRFAGFGLPIQITEFDVNVDDEQFQADYIRDFYTAAFSHPAVDSILMWGFWEGAHWMPNAAIWNRDWSTKAGAHVYMDLVTRQWRTSETLTTDASGQAQLRGFKGDYALTVVLPDGSIRTAETTIGDQAVSVTVGD